jgi:hypothetical protein
MSPPEFRLRSGRLGALLAPCGLYLAWQIYAPMLTGATATEGMIGVVLGLFTCSVPAKNGVDLLFVERATLKRIAGGMSGAIWLLLNFCVMFAGWCVLVVGTMRLTTQPV